MIEEQARVLRVQGEIAEIVTQPRSACGSCAAKNGCGTSLLAAWFPQRRLTFELRNEIGAEAGDSVVVGLDEGLLQRGSLLLYALPLGGLLLGALLGERLFLGLGLATELGAVLVGLLGLTGALLYVRRITQRRPNGAGQGVRLLRVTRGSAGLSPGVIDMPMTQQPQGFRK